MSEMPQINRLRVFSLLIAVALAVAGFAGCSLRGQARPGTTVVPVAPVKRANLQLEVQATGALRATRSVNLTAPPIGGGTLQLIRLLPTGTAVKAGEVVAAFDPSQQEYNLAQSRSDFQQAQQAIIQAKDNAAVQVAEDQTALLKAKFAVRQAQLKVKMNEMVSAIEAKENLLALDAAKRALVQTQQDVQSHAASNQAGLSVAQQKLQKARLGIDEAQQNLAKMQVKSPIDGLVVVQQNYAATGGIYFSGMTLPDFQVGDQVNPGNTVLQVIDIDQMEISAQTAQANRANIQPGDAVEIHIDAIPGSALTGKVISAGGIATGFLGAGLNAKIDVDIRLDHPDPRLRPGFSANVVIHGRRLQNVLTVPREAVFDLTGTPAVYVEKGSGFERQAVKIGYLTDTTAVVDGIEPGTEVALVNPEQRSPVPANPPAAAAPALGGRR